MGLREIFVLCFLSTSYLVLNFNGVRSEMRKLSEEEDFELERELKQLNKPARKSIVDVDGSIYDCIDVNKQPAFDHPLLKNHKIQKAGIFKPQETHNQTLPPFYEHVKIGIEGEECPEGTVIIRRTRKEELVWAKYNPPSAAPRNSYHPNTARDPGRHFALSGVIESSLRFHGVSGLFNMYRPYCKPGQVSAGAMWFEAGSETALDGVQFGWMVNPDLFGDNFSRLFGAWITRADGKQGGCYNMLCKGFVQISTKYTFGMLLKNSEYKRPYQVLMFLRVSRNVQTGDWWLGITGYNEPIGYWPKDLFTLMTDHGTSAVWGGHAYGPPNDSPPMGSAHMGTRIPFASMVGIMQVVDEQDNLVDVNGPTVETIVTSPQCYGAEYMGVINPVYKHAMFFGGAGGDKCE